MSTNLEYAKLLDDAARNAREVTQFDPEGKLSLDEAYAIQASSIQRRVERGERRVGVKMGFTSRAKMVQMGLSDVIWGRLTAGMQIEEGSPIDFSRFVHPRVEPEIAFVLKRPLEGDVTGPQALAAVEAIAPALEIIDSRYKDFKFTLPEVIADNASSSGFVIGAMARPVDRLLQPWPYAEHRWPRRTGRFDRRAAGPSAAFAGCGRALVGAGGRTAASGLDRDGRRRDTRRMDQAWTVRIGRDGKARQRRLSRQRMTPCSSHRSRCSKAAASRSNASSSGASRRPIEHVRRARVLVEATFAGFQRRVTIALTWQTARIRPGQSGPIRLRCQRSRCRSAHPDVQRW